MHAQFTGSFALVSPVLLQDVHDEALFEFTHGLRVKNAAAIHLRYECFELVLHRVSSLSRCANLLFFVASLQTAKQLPGAADVVAPAAGRSARVRPRDSFTYLSLPDWAHRGV